MNNLVLIAAVVIIVGIIIYVVVSRNKEEGMHAFASLSRHSPYYEAIPDLASKIGGRKGYSTRHPESIGAYGLYAAQKSHIARGYPNTLTSPRTLIKPSQVGFSYNSLVNRNVYADLFDSVGNRRLNPTFKYITRFTGLNLDPAKFSQPLYRFARI